MLVVRGRHFRTDELVDVIIGGDQIQLVRSAEGAADLGDAQCRLLPGLVDLQVNGYKGRDISTLATSAEDIIALSSDLLETGTTRFCPTVTTLPPEAVLNSLRAIREACEQSSETSRMVLGIHLEGPYISPEDGPRGAHPRQFVRPPDWGEFQRFQGACGGKIRLVTMAPEVPGAISFIEKAVASGVIIGIGHTCASRSQIAEAVAAGARLSTHLGNGAHAILPRHPNYIWDQLAEDRLTASIIMDGFHLPPAVAKTFIRAKGIARTVLVSDVVFAAGLTPGTYLSKGREVELHAEGVVRLSGTPFLSGSALLMWRAVENVIRFAGVSLAEAIQMATLNPARLLSAEANCSQLRPGDPGDMILLREDAGGRRLSATVLGGRVCWRE